MQKGRVVVFDLDDTLCKEVAFLRSAYREIAAAVEARYGLSGLFSGMMACWQRGGNVFQWLIETWHLDIGIQDLLTMYRCHQPAIALDPQTHTLLEHLHGCCVLGLITDGRTVTQGHKIAALGLEAYMERSDMLISEDTGWQKPSEAPYRFFMEKYPAQAYYYIGDNPAKDFVAPNRLGWTTVCLLDDGTNIHRQDFTLPADMLPQHRIENILEIENII